MKFSMLSISWRLAVFATLISRLGICLEFDCPLLPQPQPAMTVYELKPQHIKVVMALGDSVTAGALRSKCSRPVRYLRIYVIVVVCALECSGFGMMGSHGINVISDLSEYRVSEGRFEL